MKRWTVQFQARASGRAHLFQLEAREGFRKVIDPNVFQYDIEGTNALDVQNRVHVLIGTLFGDDYETWAYSARLLDDKPAAQPSGPSDSAGENIPPKRKRGRPRKHPLPEDS